MLNHKKIQEKWQAKWEQAKLYESEINDKPSLLVTAAIPYTNMPQHIGHLRTYGTCDIYARYMRMNGYNVLFPMGFHVTGTPIIAIAKKIKAKDQDLINTLKTFNILDEDIKKMEDPYFIADYFVKMTEKGMRLAGYSIDWRRKFISIDPLFSKMIEWQFYKLKEYGFLVQGSHAVGWCPNEKNAVGQHDTKKDIQPELEEVTAIKFKSINEDIFFICVTYRPETIYGVTNLFINENQEYVVAEINNEKYYLSKQSANILSNQFKIKVLKDISPKELLEKKAINITNKQELPIFNGSFVKPDKGTGIVMSVPSHAPFDYIALETLKKQGTNINFEYKKLIDIESFKGVKIGRTVNNVLKQKIKVNENYIPALAYLKIIEAETNTSIFDESTVEAATKLAYKEESHFGIMLVGKYKGKKEKEIREHIKQDLIKENNSFKIHIIANDDEVICRCGSKIMVKIIENQWFINYGDIEWKKKVKEYFKDIKIYPKKLRNLFELTIDWIDLRPTERAQGLGTRFPFNKDHIIESLSDSTIYMVFYTFSNILRQYNINENQLKPEFFSYVLQNKGNIKDVAEITNIDEQIIKKSKESFEYWYSGLMSRHSGADLISNHLVMYIFNHIALLEKKFWVKQIIINGLVSYEGQKMSKSLGNVIPLIEGINQFGTDPLRFLEIVTSDIDSDSNFSVKAVNGITSKLEFLNNLIEKINSFQTSELKHIDFWLYSKLNSKIKDSTNYLNLILFREAYNEIFYNTIQEIKWYFDRGGSNQIVLRDVIENIVLMLSPVMPHITEEFWSILGKNDFISKQKWPSYNESLINPDIEYIEKLFVNTIKDINKTIELSSRITNNKNKQIKQIKIIIADDWKTEYFNKLVETKNISQIINQENSEVKKEIAAKFLSQFSSKLKIIKKIPNINSKKVFDIFNESIEFLSKKYNSEIVIEQEYNSTSKRSFRSFLDKPSIDITWN